MQKNCCQLVSGSIAKVDLLEDSLNKSVNGALSSALAARSKIVEVALVDALGAVDDLVNASEKSFNGTCDCCDVSDELIMRMYSFANHANMPSVYSCVVMNYFSGG